MIGAASYGQIMTYVEWKSAVTNDVPPSGG